MGILRLLESLRFPMMDRIMSGITYFGSETAFMAIALLVFWCVSKRCGYYIFLVDFTGTVIVQITKFLLRVPRPWVLDPSFTIVEAAREGALDYSFPSGHSMSAVGTFGTLAVMTKQKWLRWLCGILMVLVLFSRMYLGVHTPLDVGAAFALGVLLIAVFRKLFQSEEGFAAGAKWMLAIMAVFAALLLAFMKAWRFPEDINADYLASGVKGAYSLTGAILGLIVSFFYDKKFVNFETKAPFWAQVLKYGMGITALAGLKEGLKVLLVLTGLTGSLQDTVRYFLLVVFAGCIWPLSFPIFARVGVKKEDIQ